jgi:hypothetical protein
MEKVDQGELQKNIVNNFFLLKISETDGINCKAFHFVPFEVNLVIVNNA